PPRQVVEVPCLQKVGAGSARQHLTALRRDCQACPLSIDNDTVAIYRECVFKKKGECHEALTQERRAQRISRRARRLGSRRHGQPGSIWPLWSSRRVRTRRAVWSARNVWTARATWTRWRARWSPSRRRTYGHPRAA